MNQPPFGLVFSYPTGLPGFITLARQLMSQVLLNPIGGSEIEANSTTVTMVINGGRSIESPLGHLSGNLYEAVIPALNCTESVTFYVTAKLTTGATFRDPANAPAQVYSAIAALGSDIQLRDEVEGDISAWGLSKARASAKWNRRNPKGSVASWQVGIAGE